MRIPLVISFSLMLMVLPAGSQTSPPIEQTAVAQTPARPAIILGADVSYLREMESAGTVFRDKAQDRPGLQILRDHGYTWVRLRIMNEPTPLPNTLAYTLAEAKAAKAMGFRLLLDFHYSDDWADPSHEKTPAAWARLTHDALVKAVYSFTHDTIAAFREQGAMPDMVQIGNEVTSGMLWPDGKLPDRWLQFGELVAAGVRGVSAAAEGGPRPAIMIHIDKGGNSEATKWFFDNLILQRVGFDVIGQSYYPWWQGSLKDLKDNLTFMANRYKKPIFVVETAYDWREGETYERGKPPFPETPEGQAKFLAAVIATVQSTPQNLGRGVFWWEPMATGPISKRGMFDAQHNALPVLEVHP